MAEVIISVVLQQLATILNDNVTEELRMSANLKDDVENLELNLKAIRSVLEVAEERQMTDNSIKLWLEDLKILSYDIEDVVDEWRSPSSYGRVRSLFARKIAHKIKKIRANLHALLLKNKLKLGNYKIISPLRNKESTCYGDLSKVIGRNEVKREIVDNLLCPIDEEEERRGLGTRTISIVGMGGIGKTTLARLIYNDEQVQERFEKTIWVCVSNLFDERRIAQAIILALADDNQIHPNNLAAYLQDSVTLQSLFDNVKQKIEGTKFFLVLDDVWADGNEDWEQLQAVLKHGKAGSRILVTTRKESVARRMSFNSALIYHLSYLSDMDCWSIFEQFAFVGKDQLSDEERNNLESIGTEVSKKSKGLPLIAKSLGCHLRDKQTRPYWERVMNKELCELKFVWELVSTSLFLSYYDLPPRIRQCLLYCAIFPKGFQIWTDHLIRHWMALGYLTSSSNAEMEETGREYFGYLAACCLFQDFEKKNDATIVACKMHDTIHDLIQYLTRNEFEMRKVNGDKYSKIRLTSDEARHLTIMLEEETHFPTSFEGGSKLRSLVTFSTGSRVVTYDGLLSLFKQSQLLRVLDLGWDNSCDYLHDKIPHRISDLKHLRHLNLFCCEMIQRLPDSVCQLHNLLSMDLHGCSGLKKLPDDIGNLINLRFLCTMDCSGLSYYPKGIGRLTSLRTLTDIIARADCDDPKMFSIGGLENLNNLCEILRLKLVGDAIDEQEAGKAKLLNKTRLREIKIYLDGRIDQAAANTALNPPSSLTVGFFNDNEW